MSPDSLLVRAAEAATREACVSIHRIGQGVGVAADLSFVYETNIHHHHPGDHQTQADGDRPRRACYRKKGT